VVFRIVLLSLLLLLGGCGSKIVGKPDYIWLTYPMRNVPAVDVHLPAYGEMTVVYELCDHANVYEWEFE